MCWNAEVSLNTFLFSGFVLLLIIYNNQYTKYKIPELNSVWMYIFLMSIISMQGIEFLLWRNLNDKFFNFALSLLVVLLLWFQPFASIMLIKNNVLLQQNMLLVYCLFSILFLLYIIYKLYINKNSLSDFHVKLSNAGHLDWIFLHNTHSLFLFFFMWMIYLFFFSFSFFYNKHLFFITVILFFLVVVVYRYAKDGTCGSLWCWFVNTLMVYYAAYLLFYLPFFKK
jgi:hypothetical protein